jgi:hypothetical protein
VKLVVELLLEQRDLGRRQRFGVELVEIGIAVEIRPVRRVVVEPR